MIAKRNQSGRWVKVRALLLVAVTAAIARAGADETALDRYVAKPDPSYGWKLLSTSQGDGYTVAVLELTSQTWRTEEDVDRPVWKHWLTVVRPTEVRGGMAFLYIGGGNNNSAAPSSARPWLAQLAVGTKTVVADLGMVPNQPLYFRDAPDTGRYEDDLIAYSRMRYIATGDETWLVRLPMVKSAVRAMDALVEFGASDAGGKVRINEFVVAGGSKRGWTTWLTAVVDPRVKAIIPLVIDVLNTEAATRHHLAAYGFFSPALDDYVRHKLYPDKVGTPEYREIMRIEDPYSYRNRPRLRIPKYIVNSAGDQYFLPDNSRFYFNDLQGEKYLRYVPNTNHSLAGSDARGSVHAFYQAVLDGRPRPRFSWKKQSDGSLRVTVVDPPSAVNLWQATNPEARDFRLDTIGKAYTKSPLEPAAEGVYIARVAPPEQGFTAFFVELVDDAGGPHPLKFTTEVSVVPDVLPFAWKLEEK